MTTTANPPTEAERYEAGRAARALTPRSAHADSALPSSRDPLAILRTQHESRLPWLVQLRIERMSADPFAFYRGTAAIQASDLSASAASGFDVIVCGDAHLSNFGVYRSPEQTMVFDINDFDEAFVGPWEWDVKRLLTSVVLAGRSLGAAPDDLRAAVLNTAAMYRNSLRNALRLPLYGRYFTPTDLNRRNLLRPETERMVKQTLKASEKRTNERVASRILEPGENGALRFVERPPVQTQLEPEIRAHVDGVFASYRSTLPPNLALMLSQYTVLDVARRVVGVGSVGTRCFLIALGDPTGDVLILQLKEASTSVVEDFGRVSLPPGYLDPALVTAHNGYRVVGFQRILQAVSDPFLGYLNVENFAFYMRMFRNRNASFDIAAMTPVQFQDYSLACAIVLARAHARSPQAASIAGYVGTGGSFVRAVTEWAHAYADRAEADYRQFRDAARDGYFG